MGFFSALGSVASGGLSVLRAAAPVLKSVPVVGTALTAASVGLGAYDLIKGGSSSGGLPALPGGGGGLPALPGTGVVGKRTIFGNDPNIIAALQPFAISKGNLRVSYRSPQKGFVVVHDQNGDAFALPKGLAKKYFGWKAAKKPLLSVRDTNAIKHAGAAIKKLQRAEKEAKKIANWHSPRPRQNIVLAPGKFKKVG